MCVVEYKPGETHRLRALHGVTRALVPLVPVMAKTVPCCSPSRTRQWLSVSPHLLLSIPFLPSLTSSGPSLWSSPFFAVCIISLFTCWGHMVSHSFIFPVSLPFLYRHLHSLPRALLGAIFLFFLFEKEAMQGANIICSTKLLFKTDIRKGNVML